MFALTVGVNPVCLTQLMFFFFYFWQNSALQQVKCIILMNANFKIAL